MFTETLTNMAHTLVTEAQKEHFQITTAESCTGGLVAALITHIAGSSGIFERGFVTYSNEAKIELLGVNEETLAMQGAVSDATVREMAEGAVLNADADMAISISGIAGPGGGSDQKPVGLVHFGLAVKGNTTHTTHHIFEGDRTQVREQAALKALTLMLDGIRNTAP